ncbi:F0F1 ATP synthase subunit B family protein [Amaricoccus solimangrovi]|uniref:ATP synthase subunit b n=1 Tax=Amaricoccus solimangrovi TaxID=2589815 RepID=A0A501X0G6_9RHOB|nr:ATP F0F1 synthase subunit B [Amaricoccus solimangrovi]TPE52206.1 ATP F0F1 synthase subunit B [Amaricoccus solimangrovi]
MAFLNNTEVVVTLGFLIFVAVLGYLKVPGLLASKLDQRAERIKADLAEARALREEAQALFASYERKQKEVRDQADEIVANARADAERAAETAKEDIRRSVARRLSAATDQIDAAEKAAIRQIKDRAVNVAVAAAGDVLRDRIKASDGNAMIDAAISEVGARLH